VTFSELVAEELRGDDDAPAPAPAAVGFEMGIAVSRMRSLAVKIWRWLLFAVHEAAL